MRSYLPRSRAFAGSIFLLTLLVLVGAPRSASAAWDVWVERATVKVLPDRGPSGVTTASFAAARNEWEGFQVVVRSDEPLTGVDVVLPTLQGPDGATIPMERSRAYREWLHDVEDPSDCFLSIPCLSGVPEAFLRTPGRYPDALIPLADPYDEARPPVAIVA